tara:strand:- start:7307 stop:7723 length:417 start_codon:yes stop_codon:yes gene_type:complete
VEEEDIKNKNMLGKLFSSGAADLVKNVGGVIDSLHTSKEEKLEAERKIKELVANYEIEMEKNITSRWEADLKSDSWLSKNVRPMVLIFLIICTMLLIFIDAGTLQFEVKSSWVDLLQLVLITVIGAYFGGRSFEKVKK